MSVKFSIPPSPPMELKWNSPQLICFRRSIEAQVEAKLRAKQERKDAEMKKAEDAIIKAEIQV